MKIKRIEVNGFRALLNCKVDFDEGLTLIVGENDCGKTSLVDCLKVVTQGKSIELDDFHYESDEISIKVFIEGISYNKTYSKTEAGIEEGPLSATMSKEYLVNIKNKIIAADYDISNAENDNEIRSYGRLLGVTVRSNIAADSIKTKVIEIIDVCPDTGLILDNAQFPAFNNIQLDGKQFENVSSFFKEVFLKEKQSSIWQEDIGTGKTIEEIVQEKIDGYSTDIVQRLSESGIIEKMRLFMPGLTEIKIEPVYQSKDLNIDAKVKFLEGGEEISLQKKGDGTKRRITMALLDFKKDQNPILNDSSTIYLLDEPDTHLHVKAQIELLRTLQEFSRNGDQVILTTHSPFLMNAVNPASIRMLQIKEQGRSTVRYLKNEKDITSKALQNLGIENLYVFFAKIIVLVEGETEEVFIPHYFMKKNGETLSSHLVKIINVKGISNIYGFARGILELHDRENIHVVFDNDASPDILELIQQLDIPDERKYILGDTEFEDAFSTEVIRCAWVKHLESKSKRIPDNWNSTNIDLIRNNGVKFSKALKELTAGSGASYSKPIFGEVLAEYTDEANIPLRLRELLANL